MDVSQGRELSNGMHRSTGSFELVLSPVLMGLIGLLLDRWLGTTPLLIVVLAIVGFVGAALNLYYGYKHQMDQHDATASWHNPVPAPAGPVEADTTREPADG